MKVRELIERLSAEDPEAETVIEPEIGGPPVRISQINRLTVGRERFGEFHLVGQDDRQHPDLVAAVRLD